jgi:hypothetical protein
MPFINKRVRCFIKGEMLGRKRNDVGTTKYWQLCGQGLAVKG